MDGIANGERTYLEPEPDYLEVYDGVQRLESFHKLAHAPEILDLMGKMVGEEVLPHATKIARLMFPQNNQFATPPHQDFVHIQGSTETYSCWMPLGDCPRELGGLSILAGSHQQGVFEYHPELGAGGMGVDAEYLTGEWLTTDYRAGDALIFHSMTVHKSLPNTTLDRMRFSVDYRYQAASQPIVEAYLGPHNVKSSWEEIYSGWKSKDLQYYWQNLDVNIGERTGPTTTSATPKRWSWQKGRSHRAFRPDADHRARSQAGEKEGGRRGTANAGCRHRGQGVGP